MYKLRNHTPHSVTVILGDGSAVELPPRQPTPRCVVRRVPDGWVETVHGGVSLTRAEPTGTVTDLPPEVPGVLYVVSRDVVAARPGRGDLVFPDDLVRDENGRVVACRALGRMR